MTYLLRNLFSNLAYIIVIAFLISNFGFIKRIIVKSNPNKMDFLILSLLFGGFGILGTYAGTEINGAIANTRLIGVMAGGILCGPYIGISAGLIAGIHRLLVPFGTLTAVPCSIATILGGAVSSIIYNKANERNKWLYGLIGGILMESIEMLLILLLSRPYSQAIKIIRTIYVPMGFTNGIGVSLLIVMIQSIFEKEEEIAAKQAYIALEIANKTLPYFRDINGDSLKKICEIIRKYTGADAVSITDKTQILAHVGIGEDHHIVGENLLTEATERVIKEGNLLCLSHPSEIKCREPGCQLKSAIIAPLTEGKEVIGTLKIYYAKENAISFSNKTLAEGLSHIISTQFEISRLEQFKELAARAEIKALQRQINPHFLFNALNTIVSFMRFDTAKARDLIINLSTYLRYNLELGNELVELSKELEQVRAYVEIEKARFGDKLNVIYDVDDTLDVKVPSLIIQPLVENSIKHGILEGKGYGNVKIAVRRIESNRYKIEVEDDGIGIKEDIIKLVYEGKMKENKIGISNVDSRLRYLYGKGLIIERLSQGTRVSFEVYEKNNV
ncbi:sensor histidine kinase [Caloramator sp. E03]|uniref:sensor histidine kinase n=1 Tax=Caloramator sp. E03 TaxID=2576307 RepID=UPI0011108316|nr:sensor histidine kinase [Caloramator sp. E03]QCX34201.1 sensor histidine kinase [Caloramator sp. E03]